MRMSLLTLSRISCRKEFTHRTAFRYSEQDGPLGSSGVHDRSNVIDALIQIGKADVAIR